MTSYLLKLLIRRSAIMRLLDCEHPLVFFLSQDYNYRERRGPSFKCADVCLCLLSIFPPTLESRQRTTAIISDDTRDLFRDSCSPIISPDLRRPWPKGILQCNVAPSLIKHVLIIQSHSADSCGLRIVLWPSSSYVYAGSN